MANPNTPPGGFTPEQQALNAMFEAQEGWGHALGVFAGMVEQTRRAGFTDSQAHAMVAAALVQKVAESVFVTDPKPGEST